MKKWAIFTFTVLWILCGTRVHAADFLVTSGANDGPGSLRQSAASANANSDPDVITFSPSVKEIFLSSAVAFTGDVHVNGSGATIRGSKVTRLFDISGGEVTFERLTFTDGYPLSENGGAVYIDSSAAVAHFVNCTFFGNRAGGSGAAVYVYGSGNRPTTFTHCTITHNEAAETGGGVAVAGGVVQFIASIVTGNSARLNADLHVSGGIVANTGWYNVIGQTNALDSFPSGFYNDVSVVSSDVFKTPTVLKTVDQVQVVELLSASSNVALDKIPESQALALPSIDEREAKRPQMTAIDAGSYELSPIALTSVDLQGASYVEIYTTEDYSVVVQPLEATLNVRNYTNGLSWSVSDPAILSVDPYGKVFARAMGTATLKVQAHGWDAAGNTVRESSKPVKVGPVALMTPEVTLAITDEKTQMTVGTQHTLHLDVKVLPNETPYTVTFNSGNPAVATVTQADSVSSSAVIKAISPGETLIDVTVMAQNSKGTKSTSDSYILTVTESKSSGGGCQNLGSLAGMALLGGALFLRRNIHNRKRSSPERQSLGNSGHKP